MVANEPCTTHRKAARLERQGGSMRIRRRLAELVYRIRFHRCRRCDGMAYLHWMRPCPACDCWGRVGPFRALWQGLSTEDASPAPSPLPNLAAAFIVLAVGAYCAPLDLEAAALLAIMYPCLRTVFRSVLS